MFFVIYFLIITYTVLINIYNINIIFFYHFFENPMIFINNFIRSLDMYLLTLSNENFLSNHKQNSIFSSIEILFQTVLYYIELCIKQIIILNSFNSNTSSHIFEFTTTLLKIEKWTIFSNNLNLFWFLFFFMGIFFSLNILFSKNPVYSLLFLILCYIYSSVLLIFFNVEFLGLLYIIIYVGAIAVLFLFIIMMLKFEKKIQLKTTKIVNYIFYIFSVLIAFYFFATFYNSNFLYLKYYNKVKHFNWYFSDQQIKNSVASNYEHFTQIFNLKSWIDDLNDLSLVLYSNYLYIFFLCGIILLISIVAPIVLTFKENLDVKYQNTFKQLYAKKDSVITFKNLR